MAQAMSGAQRAIWEQLNLMDTESVQNPDWVALGTVLEDNRAAYNLPEVSSEMDVKIDREMVLEAELVVGSC